MIRVAIERVLFRFKLKFSGKWVKTRFAYDKNQNVSTVKFGFTYFSQNLYNPLAQKKKSIKPKPCPGRYTRPPQPNRPSMRQIGSPLPISASTKTESAPEPRQPRERCKVNNSEPKDRRAPEPKDRSCCVNPDGEADIPVVNRAFSTQITHRNREIEPRARVHAGGQVEHSYYRESPKEPASGSRTRVKSPDACPMPRRTRSMAD